MPTWPLYGAAVPTLVTDIVANPTSQSPPNSAAVYALSPFLIAAATLSQANTYTIPPKGKLAAIYIGGAGGGGGSVGPTGLSAAGAGGGSGAEMAFLVPVTPGQVLTFTRQSNQTPAATNGGATSITVGGMTATAGGGGAGGSAPGFASAEIWSGGAAGLDTWAPYPLDRELWSTPGRQGEGPWDNANGPSTTQFVVSGAGAPSTWGLGGASVNLRGNGLGIGGLDATGFCAGGGGAAYTGFPAVNSGGRGAPGFAMIWVYSGAGV